MFRARKYNSSYIRKTFIEFFGDKYGHKIVKSSSIIPLCDPTVPFVNAGMNQFKSIILGTSSTQHQRVANSQKCIRVGGKHNDLNVVGMDGHHHTFFEMLGNWSFGDYGKLEACNMAWELVTGHYEIEPHRIMVTYFGGDKNMGLSEDFETKEIWQAIGVPGNQLKALGASDNFWEMGYTGPCGPCTELHYIGEDGTLTELWNLVFIQFNRDSDGKIKLLPHQHIDTGMGLERMTTLLSGVKTNYDTDLFDPIIRAIHKKSGKVEEYKSQFGPNSDLDTAYRTLADHSRMISICLADGMFPAANLSLKQVVRKSLKISQDVFGCESGMLHHLYERVVETLGPTYPELEMKMNDAKQILEYEELSYRKMRKDLSKKWKELLSKHPEVEELSHVEIPGFVEGYKQFKEAMYKVKSSEMPGDIVFLLYGTHGFDLDTIKQVAKLNNLSLDLKNFDKLLIYYKNRHKTSFKEQSLDQRKDNFDKAIAKLNETGIKATNDVFKYDFNYESYTAPSLKTNLLAILNENGQWLDDIVINRDTCFYLLTEDTNFYCEEGGQDMDKGIISLDENVHFKVDNVFKIKDIVFHKGFFVFKDDQEVKLKPCVKLTVDSERRLDIMRNHTCTHLLNSAVRKVLHDSVLCQVGSKVGPNEFSLSLAVYGEKMKMDAVGRFEDLIGQSITKGGEVKISIVEESTLDDGVLRVPGERYPESGLRLLHVETPALVSKELCCGTHVSNINQILDCRLVRVKGAASHTPTIYAVSGRSALQLSNTHKSLLNLSKKALEMDHVKVQDVIHETKKRLEVTYSGPGAPCNDYKSCLDLIGSIEKGMRERNQNALNTMYEMELSEACVDAKKQGWSYVVHFLKCSYLSEAADVSKAIQLVKDRPVMLLACSSGVIGVACSVPQSCVTDTFNAQKWLACILPIFNSNITSGSNENLATMKGTKVSLINCETLVQDAMRVAIAYAKTHTAPTHKHIDRDLPPQMGQRRN